MWNYIGYLILLVLLYIVYRLWVEYNHLLGYLYNYLLVKYETTRFNKNKYTIPDWFEERVKYYPYNIALVYNGKSYTYTAINNEANIIANWALKHNMSNSTVSLLMENRPEFLFTWLGLSKIGCTIALINTNLKGSALKHCIEVSKSSLIIVGNECLANIIDIENDINYIKIYTAGSKIDNKIPSYQYHNSFKNNQYSCLDYELTELIQQGATINDNLFKPYRSNLDSSSLLFYIYTSGTTGLPKAAKIKHIRFFASGCSFDNFFGIYGNDRIYSPLPMYHASGGMVVLSMAWYRGATVILKNKFSASQFFQDCVENNVTVIQYIGQIARYLLSTSSTQYDNKHNIRAAIGNGMQPEIWDKFKQRFNIPYIGEFYASTEGNANLVNNRNKSGAIGYIPWIARIIYSVKIVKFDNIDEKPVRNNKGYCIECNSNEVGELIGFINNNDVLGCFDGYTNKRATDDKILYNVFKQGDSYFRSGDLVVRDNKGYVYFIDRIGDTYRWKGENVATTEVEKIMTNFNDYYKQYHINNNINNNNNNDNILQDINVYGVIVGSNEGRAGMVSLVISNIEKFNFNLLYNYLSCNMPNYQQPLFLRITKQISITGTFKHKKSELVKQGFNPNIIDDDIIYFRDEQNKTFIKLDNILYNKIITGEIRV